ncbi:DUF2207 domain-containing protein [candidate division WOR-3 bacterium]|nr:DUF2207 domain-containing protein [candidate division WOR-3 bacterium]
MVLLFLSLYIQLFDSEIRLNKDGSLNIKEKITVNYDGGFHHGIYRDIPLELKGIAGNFSLGFKVDEVLMDGKDVPVKKTTRRYGGGKDLRLRIGDPDRTISGIHVYTIEYSAVLGARYFKEWDELYWNVTGNRWEDRIDSSRCTVIFPAPIQLSNEDIKIFVGLYGSDRTTDNYTLTSNKLSFSTGTLYPGYGSTVDIRFPKNYLTKPPLSTTFWLKLKSYIGPLFAVLLPLLIFVLLFRKWLREGKDLPIGTITVKYNPPKGLTAAEVGTILDQRVDTVDITSILFDLARLGHLSIEEIETTKFLFLKNKDFRIKILKDIDLGREKHLKDFLRGLRAKGGEEFLISDLKGEFYTYVKDVTEEIYKSVKKKGYFHGNPDTVRKKYTGFGAAGLFVGIWAIPFGFGLFSGTGAGIAVGIALSGLISLIFAQAMPKRTYRGREVLTDILGFKEFLMRVEKERLKRMLEQNPTIFFDFLSYAIALGVVDEWAERFSGLQIETPNWYNTYGGIHGPIMANRITGSIGNTISAFSAASSPPRGSSSGFSGGGGGGFSGGGGGGGGGGGW